MEILFENPLILIGILWAIASFFNKSKTDNQQQKNTRPDASSAQKQVQPKPQESRRLNSPKNRLEQMAKEMAERLDKEYLEKRQMAEAIARQAKTDSPAIENRQPVYIEVEKPVAMPVVEDITHTPQPRLSIEKQKVLDGVVWAEILGPPRALNPHRTLKRKT